MLSSHLLRRRPLSAALRLTHQKLSLASPSVPSFLSAFPLPTGSRQYISKNFEAWEKRPLLLLDDDLWPNLPPVRTDYRNYVPGWDDDEQDTWKPEEDYPGPTWTGLDSDGNLIFPVTTPRPVPVKRDSAGAYVGVGRRKTAIARVALKEGTGKIAINNRPMFDYFPCFFERGMLLAPLVSTERFNKFDLNIRVSGGGTKGQAEAIQLGIARALQGYNLAFRAALKKAGCLKRDPRTVERKKAGLVKARKRPQWSKR